MFPPTTLPTMDRPIADASSPRIPRSRWPRSLGIELAVVAVPWAASAPANFRTRSQTAFRSSRRLRTLILELTYAIAISTGIGIYLRASRTIAAGLFLGLAIVVGVREISIVLGLISGGRWYWQPVVVIALVFGECVLLLLAARAAASSSP
jgi:hypothetical protein